MSNPTATPSPDLAAAPGGEALNDRQRAALLQDEAAIERLSDRDRDGLIAAGFACRAWPKHTNAGWRTWITEKGVALRRQLTPDWAASPAAETAPDAGLVEALVAALKVAEDELHGSDSPAFNAVCRALSRAGEQRT